MTKWVLLVFSILLSGVLSAANADNKIEAKKAFATGVAAFDKNQYDTAVKAFRRAYILNPSWKLLYNIGQCEAALKRYGLAVDAFEQYLFEGGDDMSAKRRDDVLQELDRLRKILGTVMFSGPEGVDVLVDGVHRGVTPLQTGLRVAAGVIHNFAFEKRGQKIGELNEKVRGGAAIQLTIPGLKEAPAKTAANVPAEPVIATEDVNDNKGIHPLYFGVGVGATVAFAATGFALDMVVGAIKDDISDKETLDKARAMQKAGIVFYGLAGAAAVTSIVLAVFTDFKGEKREAVSRPDVWVRPVGTGIALGGRF